MSADADTIIAQLEEEERRWLQQMKDADKRTKASEVALRDAEPRVLKAEERFRKASIEAAAFSPGGRAGGDSEQKLLREKIQKAEERLKKAEDQAVEIESKLSSLSTQLSDLRDTLAASEQKLKDTEQNADQNRAAISDLKAKEAKMESELHELAVKLEVARQTHPSFKISYDIQSFVSKLLAARTACSEARDNVVMTEERAALIERAAEVASRQGYDVGEIAMARGQPELNSKKEQMEKTRQEELASLKGELEKQQREAEEAVKRAAEEKAKKELEEKLRKEAEEKLKREAEEAKRREAAEKARNAEERAKQEADEARRREEVDREQKAKAAEEEVRLKAEAEERAKQEAEKAKEEKAKSSVRKRGGPLQVGLLTYVDIDKVKEELALALRPEVTFSWVLVGYSGPTNVSFVAAGSKSVEELLEHLKDDQVQYALLRLPTPSSATKVRDILIKWYGPGVKLMEKGKKQAHIGDVKRILQPFHQELNATGRKNFSAQKIIECTEIGASHEIE